MMNLEELSGLGKNTKTVTVLEGVEIKYHTLTAGEEQKVSEYLTGFPADLTARIKPLQIETLTHSIEAINGKVFNNPKELRDFLSNLNGSVLDVIYNSYIELEKESFSDIEKLKKNSQLIPPVESGNSVEPSR